MGGSGGFQVVFADPTGTTFASASSLTLAKRRRRIAFASVFHAGIFCTGGGCTLGVGILCIGGAGTREPLDVLLSDLALGTGLFNLGGRILPCSFG